MDFAPLDKVGYQVVRSVVAADEIPGLLRETDRLKASVLASPSPDPRLRVLRSKPGSGEGVLRGLQNAHHVSPMIDALRLHPGIGAILRGRLGPDVKTILTSIFWKPAGEAMTGTAYHQDAGFRQPASAYRNLAQSYLQLAVALDPQDEANGGLCFVAGSHREARLFPRPEQSVLTGNAGDRELSAMGLAPETACPVRLEPGDLVMWSAFTVHGSPPNRSLDRDRRSFTIASMRSEDCDAGIDAYVHGRPFPAIDRPE